ncbi:chaplin [Streptomyces sp. P6-2-1]|uniref:chaplin n=1 Tax=Streptomyces sp. P6-2-1 TaxID=3422591 RepID=UPI003D3653D5
MRHTLGKGVLVTAAAASGILSLNGGPALAAESAAAGSPGILSGNSAQARVDAPVHVCGDSVDVAGIGNPVFGDGCGSEDTDASAGPVPRYGEDAPRHHEEAGPERAKPGRHAAPGPVSEAAARDRGGRERAGRERTGRERAGHAAGGQDVAGRGQDVAPRGRHAAPAGGTSSVARGEATGSPGLLSGNAAQVPLDVPLNLCGNTVDVVALLNPAFGDGCGDGTPAPEHPAPRPPRPVPPARPHVPPTTDEGDGGGGTEHVMPPRARLAETGADAGLLGAAGASASLLVGGAVLYRRRAAPARG